MIVVRAIDFKATGIYNVFDNSGSHIADIFRDGPDWYEADMPGKPQTHYVDRWRGNTKKEALASIKRRLCIFD